MVPTSPVINGEESPRVCEFDNLEIHENLAHNSRSRLLCALSQVRNTQPTSIAKTQPALTTRIGFETIKSAKSRCAKKMHFAKDTAY